MKILKKIFGALGKLIKKHPIPVLVIVAVLVLWCLFLPTHFVTKGVNMGELVFNEGSESITVYGHLYPRMYLFRTWWNNASVCEPEFTKKADQMFQEWLAKSPEYRLVSANTSSGEKEDSFGRNIRKANRRQQITREYTLEKKPEG